MVQPGRAGAGSDSRRPVVGRLGIVALGVCALATFSWVLWLTPFGPGVGPDSTVYLSGARSLLQGQGYSNGGVPITHFPPLYSIVLAGAARLIGEPLRAARFLDALLFVLNAGLIAVAARMASSGDSLAAAAASLLFLVTPALLLQHVLILSEPLFISLTVLSLICLTRYAVRPALGWLGLSGAALGLAILTRYIAAALLFPTAAVVFGAAHRSRKDRMCAAVLVLALAGAPMGFLLARNRIVAGTAVDRTLALHFPAREQLIGFPETMGAFWLPAGVPRPLVLLCLLGLILLPAIGPIILFRRRASEMEWRSAGIVMPALCLLLSSAYLMTLGLSILLLDAQTPLDSRLLTPAFVFLVIGTLGAARTLAGLLGRPILWRLFLGFSACCIVLQAPVLVRTAADLRRDGLIFNSLAWRQSPTMELVRSLPQDEMIYSNGADAIGFLADRSALRVPSLFDPNTARPNLAYAREVETLCSRIRAGHAVVVYFDAITWRTYLPAPTELASTCSFAEPRRLADGDVYGLLAAGDDRGP